MEQQKRLIFSDGTIFDDSRAMESNYGLYMNIGGGVSMHDAILVLLDPEKTKKIQFDYMSATLYFEGYTRLISIRDEGNAITAILAKGDTKDGTD